MCMVFYGSGRGSNYLLSSSSWVCKHAASMEASLCPLQVHIDMPAACSYVFAGGAPRSRREGGQRATLQFGTAAVTAAGAWAGLGLALRVTLLHTCSICCEQSRLAVILRHSPRVYDAIAVHPCFKARGVGCVGAELRVCTVAHSVGGLHQVERCVGHAS